MTDRFRITPSPRDRWAVREVTAANANKIVLIGCGKSKASEACQARDLYTGQLFAARRGYAEAVGAPWWIVSAKFGLVEPGDWLEPYDLRISDLAPVDRAAWALAVVAGILDRLPDDARLRGINCELHMGAEYAEPLRDVLLAVGLACSCPVSGLGIGEQRAWYAQRTRRAA